MDDKTAVLIQSLAEKLGTTSEYLWGVLVKQAPISGMIDLVVLSAWAAVLLVVFRLIQREVGSVTEGYDMTWKGMKLTIWWVAFGIYLMCFFICISSVITSIVNPEYWALKEILGAVR